MTFWYLPEMHSLPLHFSVQIMTKQQMTTQHPLPTDRAYPTSYCRFHSLEADRKEELLVGVPDAAVGWSGNFMPHCVILGAAKWLYIIKRVYKYCDSGTSLVILLYYTTTVDWKWSNQNIFVVKTFSNNFVLINCLGISVGNWQLSTDWNIRSGRNERGCFPKTKEVAVRSALIKRPGQWNPSLVKKTHYTSF